MSTPSAEPQVQNWIKKGEAASMLGISTRQLERYAASGRITARRTLVPGERSDRNLYLQEDVHRLKTDMENRVAAAPKVLSLQEALTRTESPAFAALTAILQQTAPPRIERAWLTLDEAAEHSGLTKAWLLREAEYYRQAASDKLPSLCLVRTRDMGKHARGGRWRFFRGDLDRAAME